MGKKRGKTDLNADNISSNYISSKLIQEDAANLEKAVELLLNIKEKYNLTNNELSKLIEEGLSFPIEIFNDKLTVLESIVKYLKEEKSLSLHKIAEVIARDERNVWNIYNSSKKKHPSKLSINKIKFFIPVSIFSNDKLSALEVITHYLHDKLNLRFSQIAILLHRDQRTIWTSYSRAKEKYAKQR